MATKVSLQALTGKQFVAADRFLDRVELTEGWEHVRRGDDDHDVQASFVREEDAAAFRAHVLDPALQVQGLDYDGPIA